MTPQAPTPSGLTPSGPTPEPAIAPLIRALGYGGLLPFFGLAALAWVVNEQALPYVALALVAYAALIASFLGGIHWGVAWLNDMGATHVPVGDAAAAQHLKWGVAPALLAWPGVLMPAHAALPWLGVLLIVCYLVDRRLYASAGLMHWLTLRFRLSAGAALSCFLAAGAV